MDINLSEIKDIAAIAKPFIDPIISTIIKPHLNKLGEWIEENGKKSKLVDNFFENKFEEYLLRTYNKLSCINVLVFPNQQIKIEDIYYPLKIESTKERVSKEINNVSIDFIKTYKRFLISDTAGMGKSTLSKWIGLCLIKDATSIPILIELKRLKASHNVLDEIFSQLNPIDKKFDSDLILKFLELGGFTILFDGFDEIEYSERQNVINDIKEFVNKAYNNNYFLTSRPDSALTSFGDFQMFHIKPLKEGESFELIRKYDTISKYNIADKLIKEIKNKPSQIKEFLINPFLVSLLYKTYSYNKDIPSKKSTFYDEVYTSLYKHHDLSKDGFDRNKKSGLDIYDFRIVLRQLAFNTAKAIKVEYSYNELIDFLKIVNNECIGIEFKELDYIDDLDSNVPLFTKDGHLFKWAHKSIQDYFAAEFISCSPQKQKIIDLIYKSNKDNYLNIIDFLYELEPELFRRLIILNLITNFIEYCDKTFSIYSDRIPESLIRERQAIKYCYSFGAFCTKKNIDFRDAEKVFKKHITNFDYLSMTKSHRKKGYIFLFFNANFTQEIINILGKKSEPIFRDHKFYSKSEDYYNILTETPLILNDEPENIANKHELFDKVNKLILSYRLNSRTASRLYILDYHKCVNLKQIIENEISLKKDNILDGI